MDDPWTTRLEDEPCDRCGTVPSRHYGHGSYVCKHCYDSWWCPKCKYRLNENHVCPTAEQMAKDKQAWIDWCIENEFEDLLED